jgi:acyl carrier protein
MREVVKRVRVQQVPLTLGQWGRREFVEPRVRAIVADRLGVSDDALVPDVSLIDDFAADSLDLLELALTLETEFGIALGEDDVAEVRSYRDLVDLVVTATRGGREVDALTSFVRSVVVSGGGERREMRRAAWLTPYETESIAADALRAGRGSRLELTVAQATTAELARIEGCFAWLTQRGIELSVGRERGTGRRGVA